MMSAIIAATLAIQAQAVKIQASVDQLEAVVERTLVERCAIDTKTIHKICDAIISYTQQIINDSNFVAFKDNTILAVSEWHTAMAKLHSAHRRVTHWKRTRAQILEPVSETIIAIPDIIIIVAIFI